MRGSPQEGDSRHPRHAPSIGASASLRQADRGNARDQQGGHRGRRHDRRAYVECGPVEVPIVLGAEGGAELHDLSGVERPDEIRQLGYAEVVVDVLARDEVVSGTAGARFAVAALLEPGAEIRRVVQMKRDLAGRVAFEEHVRLRRALVIGRVGALRIERIRALFAGDGCSLCGSCERHKKRCHLMKHLSVSRMCADVEMSFEFKVAFGTSSSGRSVLSS